MQGDDERCLLGIKSWGDGQVANKGRLREEKSVEVYFHRTAAVLHL